MGPTKEYNETLKKKAIRHFAKKYKDLRNMHPTKLIIQQQINILDRLILELK